MFKRISVVPTFRYQAVLAAVMVLSTWASGSVAFGASYDDRVRELKNGYSGHWDKVRVEGNYTDPAQAQVRANQLLRELTNPVANQSFSEVNHGIKMYHVKTPYTGISVPKWLAFARCKSGGPVMSGGGGQRQAQRSQFVTSSGSRFVKSNGTLWNEYRNQGPQSRFREVSGNGSNAVAMFDAQRNMYVLLTANRGYWRATPNDQWRPWPGSDGHWVQ